MTQVHLEVEAKYEAEAGLTLPDLGELAESAREQVGAPSPNGTPWVEGEPIKTHRLRATYFDTAERDLERAGLTLRRRTGGTDAGWHLKVPAADGARSEVRLPLGRGASTVPRQLSTMTYAVTEGRALAPVARVVTDRTVRRLVDATGRVLAEVADDHVVARRLLPFDGPGEAAGAPTQWREIELEVVDGPPDLLDLMDPVLRERGLAPATSTSKLARALGPLPTTGDVGAEKRTGRKSTLKTRSGKSAPAAHVALAHIGTQVEQIRAQDLPVRLDVPGAVHAMRVASRRLRSALTTFEPLFHAAETRPIGKELKWLAGVLGAARDAEVMRDRVLSAAGEEPPSARWQITVADEVSGGLDDAYRAAHDEVLAQLDSERYRALLTALRDLMDHPPLTDRAHRAAGQVLPRLVAASESRVRSTMKAAHAAEDEARRTELLHDARKAAKRARYAAESVVPVFGKDARRLAEAMEAVQEALGDHLDSLNAQARLLALASRTSEPSTAFTYGRLHALEEVHGDSAAVLADEAWSAARKKRLRRWLR